MKGKDAADFDYSYIESVFSYCDIEFAKEKKKIGQKCEIDVFGKMSWRYIPLCYSCWQCESRTRIASVPDGFSVMLVQCYWCFLWFSGCCALGTVFFLFRSRLRLVLCTYITARFQIRYKVHTAHRRWDDTTVILSLCSFFSLIFLWSPLSVSFSDSISFRCVRGFVCMCVCVSSAWMWA